MELDNRPLPKEVLAAISRTPEIAAQVRAVANAIRRDARNLAPKRTGRLRRGIAVERVYDRRTRSVSYIVGWSKSAFYGRFVEFGTEKMSPRPHLTPAAIANGAGPPSGGDA